jgi:Predicted membrane protein (DUF2254)
VITASVQALRPESRNGFRLVLAQEWFRERFWVVPTALLVAGMAVGVAVSRADSIPGLERVGGGLPVRAGSAEALLGIIAASMLTFVGVVFTITLVALQLASAQLSPRVIRTFVRSSITKLAFGLFLATFAYAIVVIVVEGASSSADVLRLAVTLGVLFVLASLVVFVVYVTATMRLLQVSWVVTAVADETRRALRMNRPVAASYLSAATPQVDEDPRLVRLKGERDHTTVCTSPSPQICTWTWLGTSLSSSLLPAERSSRSIPWLPLARIHEDLAEDAPTDGMRRLQVFGAAAVQVEVQRRTIPMCLLPSPKS